MTRPRRDRKATRRAEAEARRTRNTVVDCWCGNRHHDQWPGCRLKADQ